MSGKKDPTPIPLKSLDALFGTMCNLRRPAATDAMLSGHPAEPNGHPC